MLSDFIHSDELKFLAVILNVSSTVRFTETRFVDKVSN